MTNTEAGRTIHKNMTDAVDKAMLNQGNPVPKNLYPDLHARNQKALKARNLALRPGTPGEEIAAQAAFKRIMNK